MWFYLLNKIKKHVVSSLFKKNHAHAVTEMKLFDRRSCQWFGINPPISEETLNVRWRALCELVGSSGMQCKMGSKQHSIEMMDGAWSVSKRDLDLDVLNLKMNKMRKLFITCWQASKDSARTECSLGLTTKF